MVRGTSPLKYQGPVPMLLRSIQLRSAIQKRCTTYRVRGGDIRGANSACRRWLALWVAARDGSPPFISNNYFFAALCALTTPKWQ